MLAHSHRDVISEAGCRLTFRVRAKPRNPPIRDRVIWHLLKDDFRELARTVSDRLPLTAVLLILAVWYGREPATPPTIIAHAPILFFFAVWYFTIIRSM